MSHTPQQWTVLELEELPIEQGFHMRGLETTRLDTLIDAAFAVTLSILVIGQGDMPTTHAELVDAVKQIPALAASFGAIMLFWLAHRQWSRRFGLENTQTIVVSFSFIFILLIYVFPTRLIFEGMFMSLSGAFFPWSYSIETIPEFRFMFVFYSSGFLVMSLIMVALSQIALSASKTLLLTEFERFATLISKFEWLYAAGLALISIIIAQVASPKFISLAGYIYFLLFPASYFFRRWTRARLFSA